MSLQYDAYLKKHISSVMHASSWLIANLEDTINEVLPNFTSTDNSVMAHDQSKFGIEYAAYDKHFYGDGDTPEAEKEFEYAWLHHIHNNPHHWQHWVLIEDDRSSFSSLKALDIPDKYIFEMICDWWSFSWVEHFEQVKEMPIGNYSRIVGLDGIFDWYNSHKDTMVLTDSTRDKVERILDALKTKLDELI